jgi:predicted nuclease of predicted toxin-antitoxin system
MKLLADENLPQPIVEGLRGHGHDILWARTDCPGLADRALLERAEADGRLVLTLDRDFWQLALQRPLAPDRSGVILLRVHPAIPENIEPLIDSALQRERSWEGHVSIGYERGR